MKRIILLFCLSGFLSVVFPLRSQDRSIAETIRYINSLLKANPYRDNFLEITFTYSIDITPQKELVVIMEFDGPFKTIAKSAIASISHPVKKDTIEESRSSIYWYCIKDDPAKNNNCVFNETITGGVESDTNYSDNICVMFSKPHEISARLNSAFDELFAKVLQ